MRSYILLAAGPARNMSSKGSVSLMSHGDNTIIDHQVKTIMSDKNADICYVIGFHSNKIEQYITSKYPFVRIVTNPFFRSTSQSDSLKIAINATKENDIVVIHGDIIFNNELINNILKSDEPTLFKTKPNKKKVGICIDDDNATNLAYGVDPTWAQIFSLNKDNFQKLKSIINNAKHGMLTFEVINKLLKSVNMKVCNDESIRTIEIERYYENTDSCET